MCKGGSALIIANGIAWISVGFTYIKGLTGDTNGNLYIADYGADIIWKELLQAGLMNVLIGNGAAGYSPDGTVLLRQL